MPPPAPPRRAAIQVAAQGGLTAEKLRWHDTAALGESGRRNPGGALGRSVNKGIGIRISDPCGPRLALADRKPQEGDVTTTHNDIVIHPL